MLYLNGDFKVLDGLYFPLHIILTNFMFKYFYFEPVVEGTRGTCVRGSSEVHHQIRIFPTEFQ